MIEDKQLRNWLLHDSPANQEEAYQKWKLLSKAFQLLEVLYKIPKEKVEQAISIAEDLKD